MQLPIAIHKDDGSVYGVTVPDIPGCFSYGETVEEAIKNARDAIYGHPETLLDTYTKAKHETRSGFLARAAMNELAHLS